MLSKLLSSCRDSWRDQFPNLSIFLLLQAAWQAVGRRAGPHLVLLQGPHGLDDPDRNERPGSFSVLFVVKSDAQGPEPATRHPFLSIFNDSAYFLGLVGKWSTATNGKSACLQYDGMGGLAAHDPALA